MEYTEKEIKLYEVLTEIRIIARNMSSIFSRNIYGYRIQKKKEMDRWVSKIVDNLVELERVLEKAKIPKKFLILNELEDKNG